MSLKETLFFGKEYRMRSKAWSSHLLYWASGGGATISPSDALYGVSPQSWTPVMNKIVKFIAIPEHPLAVEKHFAMP